MYIGFEIFKRQDWILHIYSDKIWIDNVLTANEQPQEGLVIILTRLNRQLHSSRQRRCVGDLSSMFRSVFLFTDHLYKYSHSFLGSLNSSFWSPLASSWKDKAFAFLIQLLSYLVFIFLIVQAFFLFAGKEASSFSTLTGFSSTYFSGQLDILTTSKSNALKNVVSHFWKSDFDAKYSPLPLQPMQCLVI